jgi:hypothetical protein
LCFSCSFWFGFELFLALIYHFAWLAAFLAIFLTFAIFPLRASISSASAFLCPWFMILQIVLVSSSTGIDSWAAGSKARVFLAFDVFSWVFLVLVHKVFNEMLVR